MKFWRYAVHYLYQGQMLDVPITDAVALSVIAAVLSVTAIILALL